MANFGTGTLHTTVEGEMLDEIAFNHYGTSDGTVEEIMRMNRHIREYPPKLPAGVVMFLPQFVDKAPARVSRVWDFSNET